MNFRLEVIINAPMHDVCRLFDNIHNLEKWQPGFISAKHVKGVAGEPDAQTELYYKLGGKRIVLLETIITKNLPEEFTATYEADKVWNLISNKFIKNDSQSTIYITENEFRVSGLMKVMAWIAPSTFKKQSLLYMNYFKSFVENK